MAIPDYQSLMLPLLKRAALGEMRVLEAEKQMGEEFGLTPEERAQLLPSGKQRVLHNRAHWAKFYMMKAGSCQFFPNAEFNEVTAEPTSGSLAHHQTRLAQEQPTRSPRRAITDDRINACFLPIQDAIR